MSGGLGKNWEKVIQVLTEVMGYYDRVNRVISLGKDIQLRETAVSGSLRSGDLVLDAGCGPGTMSEIAYRVEPRLKGMVLLDPIRSMLKEAGNRVGSKGALLACGLFEAMPFRDGVFDAITMGFSLRDSISLDRALSEIDRILNQANGRLSIVDIGKSDNRVKRWIGGFHWRYLAPFLAMLTIGRKGLVYSVLHTTYKGHPKNAELVAMLGKRFSKVECRKSMLNGAVVINAEK